MIFSGRPLLRLAGAISRLKEAEEEEEEEGLSPALRFH